VTFDHPPINTVTATTIRELSELVDLIEHDTQLNVVVFDSANPDFFLAHYDVENDPKKTFALPPGPTGMHAWFDLTARLSRAPVVSIASIRGRARGAGSEFVLACDLRFASRENTVLGQFEVGAGFIPDTLDLAMVDAIELVTDEDAIEMALRLAREEGIFCGISSGAAVAVALRLARRPEFEEKIMVTVLPDAGDRYISTVLFEGLVTDRPARAGEFAKRRKIRRKEGSRGSLGC